MNYNVISYAIYLPVTIGLTIWVARTLLKNGKIFLVEIFSGNEEFANSVNNLLQVGFYLINLGYAIQALTIERKLVSVQSMMEALSVQLGYIILILGAMHFFNLYVLFRLRKKNQEPRRAEKTIYSKQNHPNPPHHRNRPTGPSAPTA
ncbi:MAG: hypothetical protein SchgKO_22720 [Schleiferiaceae bacterium]